MPNVSIELSCADYARVLPLAAGKIRAEGIDLSLRLGESGSWPMRACLLKQAINDPLLSGGESSMGAHLLRVERGDRSFIALPIFVFHQFPIRDLYVRKDGPVRTASDLIGKRMGLYSWVASGSIWYRHAQVHMGVPLDDVEWWIGDIDTAGETSHVTTLPGHVHQAPRFLGRMLVAGEIDAMWSPPRPKDFDAEHGPVVRLFPDYKSEELAYYRKTGIFPMMHLIVIRRDVWERNPWIGKSLTKAFQQANDQFYASQRGFSDAFPWMEQEIAATDALLGGDCYGHGLTEANRKAVDVFITQARDAGIIGRPISIEEYFEDYLQS